VTRSAAAATVVSTAVGTVVAVVLGGHAQRTNERGGGGFDGDFDCGVGVDLCIEFMRETARAREPSPPPSGENPVQVFCYTRARPP
jgi:hypothetical protein